LNLNRAPDAFHSLSVVPVNGFQIDLARTANTKLGDFRVNVGYQGFDEALEQENGFLLGIEFNRQY